MICLSLILLTKGYTFSSLLMGQDSNLSHLLHTLFLQNLLTNMETCIPCKVRLPFAILNRSGMCANRIMTLKDHNRFNLPQDLHDYIDAIPLPYYIHGVNSVRTCYSSFLRSSLCWQSTHFANGTWNATKYLCLMLPWLWYLALLLINGDLKF